jgi:hypothetical protein
MPSKNKMKCKEEKCNNKTKFINDYCSKECRKANNVCKSCEGDLPEDRKVLCSETCSKEFFRAKARGFYDDEPIGVCLSKHCMEGKIICNNCRKKI